MKYVADISEKGIHIYFKEKPLKGCRLRIEDLNISTEDENLKSDIQYVYVIIKEPIDLGYSIDPVYRKEIGKVIQDLIYKNKIKLLEKEEPYIAVRLKPNAN